MELYAMAKIKKKVLTDDYIKDYLLIVNNTCLKLFFDSVPSETA